MTTARVAETSVTFNNNSPFQDYVHQDDQTQPTFQVMIIYRLINILSLQLSLQLILTIKIIGEFYCGASYYATSSIASQYRLTFCESEET